MSTRTNDRSHRAPGAENNANAESPEAKANGAIKDPKDWTTGDEPMTGAQESYLDTLARQAGEQVDGDLTKAEASEKIDELRHKTGRDATPSKQKTLGAAE
jgi:hypothetical protein